jgi:hypothetical protein
VSGMQQKTRLLWVLPAAQVAFAELTWHLNPYLRSPVKGDWYWRPTLDLFCAGLNAPADWMNLIVNRLEHFRGGTFFGQVQYMLLVAILWYLVAWEIDKFGLRRRGQRTKLSAWEFLTKLFLVLYGLDMLLVIGLHNIVFTPPHFGNGQTSNFIGDVLHQGLWLVWSLALIGVPVAALLRARRNQNPQQAKA